MTDMWPKPKPGVDLEFREDILEFKTEAHTPVLSGTSDAQQVDAIPSLTTPSLPPSCPLTAGVVLPIWVPARGSSPGPVSPGMEHAVSPP